LTPDSHTNNWVGEVAVVNEGVDYAVGVYEVWELRLVGCVVESGVYGVVLEM
jgi:hypothetical protein